MKLAFFTSIIPDGNPTTGFEIANEAVLNGLRSLGHQVSVFGFCLPRQTPTVHIDTHVLGTFNVENARASKVDKAKWLVRALVSRLPISAAKLTAVSNHVVAQVLEREGPFDAHIINSYQMAAAFPQIKNTPYVYLAHNVEHRSAAENANSAKGGLERYFYRRDARLLEMIEHELCSRAKYVWTLSGDDLAVLNVEAGGGGVLPLITPWMEGRETGSKKVYDAGLIGTWSWQPNFVGLKWFLDDVVTQLPHSMSIAIAGNVPDGTSSKHPGVKFLGRVESAADFLDSTHSVPLVSRGGTGVQLKTIEAMQAGYACVATSPSLRGIDDLPANCRRADDAAEFAAKLDQLVTDLKSGKVKRADGGSFFNSQRDAMLESLTDGIGALS